MSIRVDSKLSSDLKDETKSSKHCTLELRWPPFRYYVMIMGFLSATFMFATRCVINVAILAMVRSKTVSHIVDTHLNSSEIMEPVINSTSAYSAPVFHWNQAQQGIILGSYFYSYTAVQIVTGFLADKFNIVKLNTFSHLFSAFVTLIIPIAAQHSLALLILCRIFLGLVQGPILPTCYILFEKWFTPQEKAFAQALMNVGTSLGVAIAMPIVAWLCDYGFAGGWPSAFYCMGIANAVYAFFWFFTVTANPVNSKFTSDKEKAFITGHVIQIPKRKVKVPWKSMFMSLPLWSVTLARGICSLGYHTVNSKIPLYMESVLGYSLQGDALINAAFYVAESLGLLMSGPLSKYVASAGWMSLTAVRKLFEGIALIGPTLFLLSIPLLHGHSNIIVLGLFCTMLTMGATSGGDIPIVTEMAPGLVGTVWGFSNTISCAAGFLAPMTIGYILGDQPESIDRWNITFYFFGSLQVLGFIFFALFATSKPLAWAHVDNTTKTEKSTRQEFGKTQALEKVLVEQKDPENIELNETKKNENP